MRKSAKVNVSIESVLENIVKSRDRLKLRKGAKLFSQGEEAEVIYFIETGKVQLTVVSSHGKRAVLDTLGPRAFLGEGCLVGDSVRTSTATGLEPSIVFRIGKVAMLEALHGHPNLSEKFMTCLLARNVELEEDLRDQLFNHTERRLARALLKLSRFGRHDKRPDTKVPRFTHTMLAEIVGTTRLRISSFMNKFRKLGLIDFKGTGDITVKDELLTEVILHD